MNFRQRKGIGALLAILVVALAAIGAYAYWTSAGDGSHSGTAASAAALTVTVSFPDGQLHPGGNVAVTGSITNNTTSDVQVATVTQQSITASGSCAAGDFHFTGTVTGGSQVLSAAGGSTGFTGTLSMDETGSNQDACQGATITLTVHAA
jgi:hypothetical protein